MAIYWFWESSESPRLRQLSTDAQKSIKRATMTAIFWLVVTLGGMVGFVVFIAPDFATRQSVSFLAKWRSLRRERTKLKELRLFALISRIHAHRRDRYIFVTMSSQIVAAIAIMGAGIAAIFFVLLVNTGALKKLIPVNIRFAQSLIAAFIELILSIGTFALLFSFSILFSKRLLSIKRKLSNYKEYRKDVIHRWGKEEVSKIDGGVDSMKPIRRKLE